MRFYKTLPINEERTIFLRLILTSLLKYMYKTGLITVPVFANSIDKIFPRRGVEIPNMDSMQTMAYGVQLM